MAWHDESHGDFEAVVRILTEREGGRGAQAYNGIRWDLRYFFQGEDECSMVRPEFLDESGDAIPSDRPLSGMLKARFYVVAEAMREFHLQHAYPGAGIFCVEGPKVCAAGVITRLTGLARDGRVSAAE